MKRNFWFNFVVFLLSLSTTVVALAVWIMQSRNFQLFIFQDLYNTIDKSGIAIRAVLMSLISLSAGFFILRSRNNANSRQSIKWGIFVVAIGLIIGLVVFYAHSCCESLVEFNLGFPLSWLRSLTRESLRLPMPEFQYLIQNIGNMYQWYIDVFSLLANILFWYCAGVSLYIVLTRESISSTSTGKKGA